MRTRKSKTVGIHLNDAEYTEIKARAEIAAARSLGGYIKSVVFGLVMPEKYADLHASYNNTERRKCKTVGIHLNDDEYAEIKVRADATAARSIGAYIKAILFNTDIPEKRTIRHIKVADPALIRQLAWIGNNVNQISRVINQSKSISKTETASLFAVLSIIAEELEAMNEDAL